jgi:hypothetical protein
MRLLAIACLIGLTGCALVARREVQERAAACRATYPLVQGTAVSRFQCIEQAEAAVANFRPPPGNELVLAFSEAVAQRIDAGTLSAEDGRLAIAEETAKVDGVNQANAIAAAQANAAMTGALLQGSAALYQAARPYRLPGPVNTNCYQEGAFTNCTSY